MLMMIMMMKIAMVIIVMIIKISEHLRSTFYGPGTVLSASPAAL